MYSLFLSVLSSFFFVLSFLFYSSRTFFRSPFTLDSSASSFLTSFYVFTSHFPLFMRPFLLCRACHHSSCISPPYSCLEGIFRLALIVCSYSSSLFHPRLDTTPFSLSFVSFAFYDSPPFSTLKMVHFYFHLISCESSLSFISCDCTSYFSFISRVPPRPPSHNFTFSLSVLFFVGYFRYFCYISFPFWQKFEHNFVFYISRSKLFLVFYSPWQRSLSFILPRVCPSPPRTPDYIRLVWVVLGFL